MTFGDGLRLMKAHITSEPKVLESASLSLIVCTSARDSGRDQPIYSERQLTNGALRRTVPTPQTLPDNSGTLGSGVSS